MILGLGLVIGLIGLVLALVALRKLIRARKDGQRETATKATDSVLTYGHPRSPVVEVRKRLPQGEDIPVGHFWELTVTREPKHNSPVMKLALVNSKTGEEVHWRAQNLFFHTPPGSSYPAGYTWKEYYEEWSEAEIAFWTYICDPFVKWAKETVSRMYRPNDPDHHEVIT